MRPGCGLRRGTDSFIVPPLGALCLPVLLALLVWLAAAPVAGVVVQSIEVRTPDDYAAAFATYRITLWLTG